MTLSADPGPSRHRRDGLDPRAAAAGTAVVAVVVLVLLYVVFVVTPTGQALDHAAFRGAVRGQGQLWRIASPVLDVVSEGFVVVGLAVAVLVAAVRRRWALAVQATVLVAGANLSTQLLKAVLDRPEHGIGRAANSFPSGHTTVAASVVVALLVVVPRRWRPVVAVAGAGYAALTGVSVLVGQWHRVSDSVAALVVVVLWTALATLVVPRAAIDRPSDAVLDEPPSGARATVGILTVLGVTLATVAAVGGVLVARQVGQSAEVPDSERLAAYGLGVVAVVAATCLALGVVLWLRTLAAAPRAGVYRQG